MDTAKLEESAGSELVALANKAEEEAAKLTAMRKADTERAADAEQSYARVSNILARALHLAEGHFAALVQRAGESSADSTSAESTSAFSGSKSSSSDKEQFLQDLKTLERTYKSLAAEMKQANAKLELSAAAVGNSLNASVSARKRALARAENAQAAAEGDAVTAKFDMEALLADVERGKEFLVELDSECGPKMEGGSSSGSGEKLEEDPMQNARLERLKQEIAALEDAARVLEGQEIPVA